MYCERISKNIWYNAICTMDLNQINYILIEAVFDVMDFFIVMLSLKILATL